MVDHPKLHKSPLIESLFEIQFNPVSDYALFAGSVYSSIKNDFSNTELLVPPELPDIGEWPKILRHRFKRNDGSALFQLGNGIMSVNLTKYDKFTHFISLIKNILREIIAINSNIQVNRLGLRYINRIPLNNKSVADVLSINISTPTKLSNQIEAINIRIMLKQTKSGKILLRITNPIENGKPLDEIIFDLDCSVILENVPIDIRHIEEWINTAHDSIYDNFIGSLNSEYKKAIE
ncbi:TIGR04255 family protein [Candidatus Saganbacteria bacterium]|nr:TIGR04255 family protein [Candidatus Saganbacteria bacterium]